MLQNLDDGHYLWELWFTIISLYKFSRIEKSKIVCHVPEKHHENNTQRNLK